MGLFTGSRHGGFYMLPDGDTSSWFAASDQSLSQPAVTERVKRMEDKGIIEEYRTILSPEKIGKQALICCSRPQNAMIGEAITSEGTRT
jgi:hypothetical protein